MNRELISPPKQLKKVDWLTESYWQDKDFEDGSIDKSYAEVWADRIKEYGATHKRIVLSEIFAAYGEIYVKKEGLAPQNVAMVINILKRLGYVQKFTTEKATKEWDNNKGLRYYTLVEKDE